MAHSAPTPRRLASLWPLPQPQVTKKKAHNMRIRLIRSPPRCTWSRLFEPPPLVSTLEPPRRPTMFLIFAFFMQVQVRVGVPVVRFEVAPPMVEVQPGVLVVHDY